MMSVVIVAIPQEDDYVWKLSSETIPHMTLLFLGDIDTVNNGPELARIETFIGHVADTMMTPFSMTVDHRGVLGPDDADVLFFRNTNESLISKVRNSLLQDTDIRLAHDAAQQFPEWTPHLTLGYPATPAHEDTRMYPGTRWVEFDKIGMWLGDFDGPTFQVYDRRGGELSMKDHAKDILTHHGVKGMHWGVRRAARTPAVTVMERAGKKKVKTTGGDDHPAHADAKTAATKKQIAKKNSTDALSTKELKDLVERMNLEQQYSRLSKGTKGEGQKYAEQKLRQFGDQKFSALLAKNAAKAAVIGASLA